MHVLLIQVDGKLPNVPLMKISAWHKKRGIHFYKQSQVPIAEV